MKEPDAGRPDLNSEQLIPYRSLDTANRRAAAGVYLVAAAGAAAIVVASGVEFMWITAVVPLIGVAIYQFIAGRSMQVTDMQAIEIASDTAPFEVGHGSATLGFTGVAARPIWQVLVFEAGPAPEHQALVTVDALSGDVTGTYSEEVEIP